MKKITLLILTFLLSFVSSFGQTENFDGGTTLPTGWVAFNDGNGPQASILRWNVTSLVSASAPNSARSQYYIPSAVGVTTHDWLVTKAIAVPQNGQLQLNVGQLVAGNQFNTFKVLVATSFNPTGNYNTDSAGFNQVAVWSELEINSGNAVSTTVPGQGWEQKTVSLQSYSGQTVYIAFVREYTRAAANVPESWLIDDIRVASKCLTPTALQAPTINMTSASLAWSDLNSPTTGSQWEIVYATAEQSLAEAITNNQTLPGAPNVPGGPSLNYTIPIGTLLPDTDYKYYIRAVCSPTNKSDWSDPYFFTTAGLGETCAEPIVIPGIPYSTNGDTADSNDRTDVIQASSCVTGTVNYMAGNEVFYSFVAPTTGEVRIELSPTGPNSSIFVYNSCPAPGQSCLAGVANTTSGTRIIPNLSVTAGSTYIVVISSSAATQTVGYYLEIQYVTCAEPTGLAVPTATMTGATLSWNNPIPVVNWQIAVQPAGATIPQGAGVPVSTADGLPAATLTTTIGNLTNGTGLGAAMTSGTAYQYWVRGECAIGGTTYSPWAGPFQFITPVCDPVNQCNHTFRLTRSGGAGWGGAVMQVKQNGVVVKTLGPDFTTGTSSVVTVALCENIPFELVWVTGGTAPNNIGVIVNNSYNQLLYQKPAGIGSPSATVPLYSATVICDYPRCVPPINQNFNSVTASSAVLTWTAATNISASAWQIYIMPTAEATAPLDAEPVASTAPGYYSGPTVVSGYLASGLRSDTPYVYYVRTVCDGVRGSDWVGPITFRTAASCGVPTVLLATGQSTTSAILSWTQPVSPAGGTATQWEIVVQAPATGVPAYNATSIPVSGGASINYGVAAGTTPLTAATQYEYYVRAVCSGTDKSRWAGPYVFKTLCDPINVPYTEGFNTGSQYEICWTALNVTGTTNWDLNSASPFEGDQSASVVPTVANNNNYLISPTLNLLANYRVRFRYKVESAGANNTVKVLLSTTGIAPASFTTELLSTRFTNTTYEERAINLDNIAPGQINVAFQIVGAATATRIYIDNVIFEPIPPCPAPQDLNATNIQSTTADLSWSAGHSETQWQVVVQPAGTGVPALNYTGPIVLAPSNLNYPANTAGDLNPANPYEFYVRAYCSDTQQSSWSGPYLFKTVLCNPADLCTYRFTMTDTASNGWGTSMTVVQNNTVVATLTGPATGASSFVDVSLCPGIQFELRWFDRNVSTTNAGQVGVSITSLYSSTVVYTKAPGAGSPNSVLYKGMPLCSVPACPFPTDLTVSQTSPTSVQLTWTPGGTETQWQYIYQLAGGNYPGSNPSVPPVNVNGTPVGNISGLTQAIKYEYYVRAICSNGPTGFSASYWSGPHPFTVYNSPGCLGVDIGGVTNPIGTEITVCPSGPPVHLEATYFEVKSTSSYRVDSIPYSPPFPFTGGENSISLTSDDFWSNVVNLDFNFCFFGTSYDKLLVSDNGAISFSVAGPNGNGGRYTPLAACGWAWTQNIPFFPAANNVPPYTNAIFGVMQDLYPSASPADHSFNYEVLGTAPCRAFVMNVYKLASFSCTSAIQTSQIVLYEGSNMIDVYVESRTPCTGTGAHNGGRGIIGIQGSTTAQVAFPPNRNTGNWTATREAWRFVPDGVLPAPQFEWQLNGNFYSNNLNIDVPTADIKAAILADGHAKLEAVATYLRCGNPVPLVRKSEVNVRLHDMPVADPQAIQLCASTTNPTTTFNLLLNNPVILATVPVANQADYEISYYLTRPEAEVGTTGNLNGTFDTAADTEIFVRIKNTVNGCVEIRSFFVRVNNNAPVYTLTGNTTICTRESTTISVTPPTTGATYEWILPDGSVSSQTGPDLLISPTDAQAGTYTVKVNNGCETVDQFILTITPDSTPVADFTYTTPVCITSTTNPVAILGTTTTPGGKFSVPVGSPLVFVNDNTGEIDIALTPAGSYTVTYTILGTLCNPQVTFSAPIVITPLAPAITAFTYANATVCANGTVVPTLQPATGFTPNGIFTVTPATGLIVDQNTGQITLNSATLPGDYFIEYSFAGDPANCIAAGNSSATPFKITINSGINPVTAFDYNTSYCLNSGLVTPTPTFDAGGQFTVSPNTGLSINTITGAINTVGSTPGTYVITYKIAANAATCRVESFSTDTITIEPEIDITIDNDCENNNYILTASPFDSSYDYTWKNASGLTVGTDAAFNVTQYASTLGNSAVYPMVFTVTVDNNGCLDTEPFTVPNISCNIPKGVSPNGDGDNDDFDLTG
ncbi:choice-of-anchor J domain-containing protein, partial [uncultured Flavobacterium sp.]|uniref:choice-of-anchor J domain-containing protein n=1 Tax=uncultured Flavobacterium sp. TaxID=165435 RepID=UPI0025DD2114